MTSTAAARILPEPAEQPKRIHANSQTVTAVDQAHLHKAIDSVSWERRGPLQRLTRRP
jgi:hypothetical protein